VKPAGQRGFTLVEVVIALAILAVSMSMLMTTQAASVRNAGKSRELTLATLLARSKLIDIEQLLFDDGFVEGEQVEEGNFGDEGYEKTKWKATITELEMDIGSLSSLCGLVGGGGDEEGGAAMCDEMLGGIGGLMEGFMQDFGRSLRLVELTVIWPVGERYTDQMTIRGLVTRGDYTLQPQAPPPPPPGGP